MFDNKEPWNIRQMWIIVFVTGMLLAVVVFILMPRSISNLSSRPNPEQRYEDAVRRVDMFRGQEPQAMNPFCRLQLMTHDRKTDRAVILVHGYTSCPQQFHELGERLHASGCNVLIAPLPHHGLADRMTEKHSLLRAEELAVYADTVVDIAQGLGKEVVMMGISAGGVTTAWAAQQRDDIDVAVIISPAFGFREIPTPLTAAVMNIFSVLPDKFTWWNPVHKAEAPPFYAYPRYSRRALAQILRLGFAVQRDIGRNPPAAKKVVMVFNANDDQINNELTQDIVERWQSHNIDLITYEFDASLKLSHDLIDPSHPGQRIDIVYPKLVELIGR